MPFLRIVHALCAAALLLTLGLDACAANPLPEASVLPPPPIYPPTIEFKPTPFPSRTPHTTRPTDHPTTRPPDQPTSRPSDYPTIRPSDHPTTRPSDFPTSRPADQPTIRPRPFRDLAALNEYQRGIAYVALDRNAYRSPASQRALDQLFATGANYISLLVTWYQDDVRSTNIYHAANTPADEDLVYVINYAHAHQVKVLLKPQLDLAHDSDHWRGEIGFEHEQDWRAWFDSYRKFVLHYARLAQANGVEEFSVGTELVGTTHRTAEWRVIIRAVRQEYTGLLTYSANHSGEEMQITFWDDLDFIGVNVFYHLTNYRDPTLEQLLPAWELPVQQLTNLHTRFPKQPIIFTEVGYPSLDLANVWPWNWDRVAAVDLQEQADLYEALFQTWWQHPERPWFRGLFIWNWRADPNQGGPNDDDYTPHNKPAEQVLKKYFKQTPTARE